MTLQQAIDNYLLICRIEGLPLSAIAVCRKALDDFLDVTGDIKVSSFQPSHVERYTASLGGARAKQAKGILRMFCQWLLAQTQMRHSPAQPSRPSQILTGIAKVGHSWVI
jgi:site-specific recombinase XerC